MLISFSLWSWIAGGVESFFIGVLLFLDSVVYSLISWVYQIILVLSKVNILSNNTEITSFVNRLYVIIGVIMLFVLAYTLLKALINPDDLAKDKKSPAKLITNVLISIAAIAFVPFIFNFAMEFQTAILNQGTIGKIILGTSVNTGTSSGSTDSKELIDQGGNMIAATVLGGFLHPNISNGTCTLKDGLYTCPGVDFSIDTDIGTYWSNLETNGDFLNIIELSEDVKEGRMTYYYLLSTIAGAVVLIILMVYCFNIALRVVKLSVYELIAPLPILCRIVPNDQAGKVFSNWLKATISTYIEIFINLAILFFGVWIMKIVTNNISNIFGSFEGSSPEIALIAQVLIILGIIAFIKQAPDIIKEITGLDSGKFNPLKTLKQGISFIGGSIAGRSLVAGYKAMNQAGEAKDLLDFSAIGNQYRRREAKKEAKLQGAKTRDRVNDALRKRFGFETKKERADRMLERGLDINGDSLILKNDAEDAIFYGYEQDAMGNFIMEDVKDKNGNIVYEKNADGTDKLDANGNKIAKQQRKKKTLIAKDKNVEMSEDMMRQLQHEKDQLAIYQSAIDEKIRQIKDGQKVDQKFIDWRGKIKKKALEKINEGHNHIKKELTYSYTKDDGTLVEQKLGEMNYAAMLAYKQSRINDGASAKEISALEQVIKKNEDEMWVQYSNWAIKCDVGGEINTWYNQAVDYHNDVGLYDAKTDTLVRYDKADLAAQQSKKVMDYVDKTGKVIEVTDNMAIFESGGIKLVNKDGTAFNDDTGKQVVARGFDKYAKANANESDTIIQGQEVSKIEFGDNAARIDRLLKQQEERKTLAKSSEEYMRYKASDNANKINDSGKK